MLEKKITLLITCLQAMRPHHIAKNILLLFPLLVGHHYLDLTSVKKSIIGFLVFCLLASSTYIINDLIDLEHDRQHPIKKKRPLAAGQLSLVTGFSLACVLLGGAFMLSLYLPRSFLVVAASYYLSTVLYSLVVKQKKWLDIIWLAALYCLRMMAGMTLVKQGYSLWLIVFTFCFFLGLACLKRYVELADFFIVAKTAKLMVPGRAYRLVDRNRLFCLGQLNTFFSFLTVLGYIYSDKVQLIYKNPSWLWLVCPCLLFWIKRLWCLARQGKITEDPVLFTLQDKVSWFIFVLIALIMSYAAWVA